jgi:glycosyltransferase involved in cell wall biosynthesis
VLGFVGRIEPRKGQRDLVEVLAHLHRTHPTARLELVGPVADAHYAATVRATIKRAGLTAYVAMPGEVPSPARRMRHWDLFVSLSADEGQGLAVLEAMATGVPVAARPVAGVADFLVGGRNGFTIARPDPRSVARTLARVLAQPGRMAEVTRAARRMVERRYAWDDTVRTFERLYRAVD